MLSTAGTPSSDVYVIMPRERKRFSEQFASLKPSGGYVTGEQARNFFLQSQLESKILAQIWALADTDEDGRLDLNEFSIACKLINLKLRNYDVPTILPPTLLASLQMVAQPPVAIVPPAIQPVAALPPPLSPPPPAVIGSASVSVSNTPRAGITSFEKAPVLESPQNDWAVPHQSKLKFTQQFNSCDKTRCGYLTGAQVKNILTQWGLPQLTLASIWSLANMGSDGRLSCEEFVLACHLCELAAEGRPVPNKLPYDLIPPSFRRGSRSSSISSHTGVQSELDPAATLLQSSFEDKRKENYVKGQAELERRRRTLLDQQRKEAEERERKEREEIERRERARQEAERKRLEELEQLRREQEEQERLREEERRRQAEQREAARREAERQRQEEWEKQRLLELQQQRQREQEAVLKLKARNQTLRIDLTSLNEHIRELSQRICDTRLGVSTVKSTIDGMRNTRDIHMQEQSQLKQKLKEQNNRLLALSQEKVKLEAKNRYNTGTRQDADGTVAFEANRDASIKSLKEKIDDMLVEVNAKSMDIETNNNNLMDLRTELKDLISECETLYTTYECKRDQVIEMKRTSKTAEMQSGGGWQDTNTTTWSVDRDYDDNKWKSTGVLDMIKYRALYEFTAQNHDEISFQPGDFINVAIKQTGDAGWLSGEIAGKTGWFPESYAEPVDGVSVRDMKPPPEEAVTTKQQIEEMTTISTDVKAALEAAAVADTDGGVNLVEYYIANYPFQSQEPGDLAFNAGDVITVTSKSGEWWTGKLGDNVGLFPSNYVQKVDVNSTAKLSSSVETSIPSAITTTTTTTVTTADEGVKVLPTFDTTTNIMQDIANSQIDNEVSQITSSHMSDRSIDSSSSQQNVKSKKSEIASVIAAYEASSPEQLSLARGQLIMIRKKADTGWWEGELQAKGRKRQVGWFPASYVKVMNSSGRISGRTTPVSSARIDQEIVLDKVVALFAYTAANPDELSFAKDDIISVTARVEDAWWKGELNGTVGLFPSNYVTPLQQQ